MKLSKALAALKPLKGYDKLVVQEKLNSGFTLISAEKRGFQTAIKYVFKVKGNLLYVFKLCDSTEDHIVLTLESVTKMAPDTFSILYEQHLAKQDLLLEDVEDNFGNVEENTFNKTEADIKEMMNGNGMIAFQ